jgi:DNA-binding response OmpR family regulator
MDGRSGISSSSKLISRTNANLETSDDTPAMQSGIACFDPIYYFSSDPGSDRINALKLLGCTVLIQSIDEGLGALAGSSSGVIVIDMPQSSQNFSICRQLRTEGIELPLVTITSAVDPFDELLGLELGADAVIDNLVHPRVLLARLRAISRRALGVRDAAPSAILVFGDLRVDGDNREVTLRGRRVMTTSGEFDLLWLLVQNAGQVVRRDVVLRRLRGLTDGVATRSVDARLYRLRRRFANVPDIAARIKSVRPNGYMFAKVDW